MSKILFNAIGFIPNSEIKKVFGDEPYEVENAYRPLKSALRKHDGGNIITTQMALLKTDWLEKGYRVFVFDWGTSYEIKYGDNERTKRYIRMGHDLFRMWNSGEFEEVEE